MIPKIIHQLWIGPYPAPLQYMETWKNKNPTWDYIFWDEARLAAKTFRNQSHVDAMPEWNGKCDIYRYEILKEYGGFFIDADSLCLLSLPDEFCDNDSFSCYESEFARPGLVAAGYLACVPDCELMDLLIQTISEIDTSIFLTTKAWESVGPMLLTKVINLNDYKKITIYPSHYFIPYHYTGVHSDEKPNYAFQLWGTTAKVVKMEFGKRLI